MCNVGLAQIEIFVGQHVRSARANIHGCIGRIIRTTPELYQCLDGHILRVKSDKVLERRAERIPVMFNCRSNDFLRTLLSIFGSACGELPQVARVSCGDAAAGCLLASCHGRMKSGVDK